MYAKNDRKHTNYREWRTVIIKETIMRLVDMLENESIDLENQESFEKWQLAAWEHDLFHLMQELKENISAAADRSEKLQDNLKDANARSDTFRQIQVLRERIQTYKNTPALPHGETLDDKAVAAAYVMKFLIKNWLPAEFLSMLIGQSKIGKSILTFEIVIALAMGYDPFQGVLSENPDRNLKPTLEPINITYCSYEEPKDLSQNRIHMICQHLPLLDYDAVKDRIQYIDFNGFGPLWGVDKREHRATRQIIQQTGLRLFEDTKAHQSKLLVIDPLAAAFGGNENDRTVVREFTGMLNRWARMNNCAVLLIAHPAKAEDSEYSGSTDWLGSCRAMWNLRVGKGKVQGEPKPKRWYELFGQPSNYARRQLPKYFAKVKSGEQYTAVWAGPVDKKEAIKFYDDYNQGFEDNMEDFEDEDDPVVGAFVNDGSSTTNEIDTSQGRPLNSAEQVLLERQRQLQEEEDENREL